MCAVGFSRRRLAPPGHAGGAGDGARSTPKRAARPRIGPSWKGKMRRCGRRASAGASFWPARSDREDLGRNQPVSRYRPRACPRGSVYPGGVAGAMSAHGPEACARWGFSPSTPFPGRMDSRFRGNDEDGGRTPALPGLSPSETPAPSRNTPFSGGSWREACADGTPAFPGASATKRAWGKPHRTPSSRPIRRSRSHLTSRRRWVDFAALAGARPERRMRACPKRRRYHEVEPARRAAGQGRGMRSGASDRGRPPNRAPFPKNGPWAACP